MESLQNYTHNNVFICESAENTFKKYGKDIDSAFHKINVYTHNMLYNRNVINEHYYNYNVSFTANESTALQNILINVCEDYISRLQEDIQIIEEGKLQDLWNAGKEKLTDAVNSIKTKIKELNQLIKDLANKVIKSVKDMAERLMSILEKIGCTFLDLFKKAGFDTDALEKEWMTASNEIAKTSPKELIKKLQNNNVYEAYQNYLNGKTDIITEDCQQIFELFNNKNKPDYKTDSKGNVNNTGVRKMLWNAFIQLGIWATICVIIPGTVVAFFPGTFIALLIPIVCKLGWNCYKIVRIWKKWRVLKRDWHTYKKKQKVIQVICMIASIIAVIFNFKTAFSTLDTVLEAFKESGYNILASAQIGVSPDVLQRGFAAFLKSITEGKFGWDDFSKAFNDITHSFAEHITTDIVDPGEGLAGGMTDDNVSTIKDFLHDKMQGVGATGFTKNMAERWDELKSGLVGGYHYFADNIKFPGGVDKVLSSPAGQEWLHEYGHLFTRIPFTSGNAVGKTWSALYAFKEGIDGEKAMNALLGVMNNVTGNGVIEDLGTVASEVITSVSELGPVVDMFITIPTFEISPEQRGFRVRLGSEKDKENYVYEIGKEGVKLKKMSESVSLIKDNNAELINTINKYNKDIIDTIDKAIAKCDDDGNSKDKEQLEKKKKQIEESIKNQNVIIYYGEKVDIEETNESYSSISLQDYLIFEGYTETDIAKSYKEIVNYLVDRSSIDVHNKMLWRQYLEGKKEIDDETLKNSLILFGNKFSEQGDSIKKNTQDNAKDLGTNGKLNLNKDDINTLLTKCFTIGKELSSFPKKPTNDSSDEEKKEYQDKRKKAIDLYKEIYSILQKDSKFDEDVKKKKIDIIKFASKKKQESSDDTEQGKPQGKDGGTENGDEPIDGTGDKAEEKSEGVVPVLVWSPVFLIGCDLAKATKEGPRKKVYTMKNMYENLQYFEMKGGLSRTGIEDFLGEQLIVNGLIETNNTVTNKPCTKGKLSSKFKVNDKEGSIEPNKERLEFGKFTNTEITEILNDHSKGKNYLKGSSSGKISKSDKKKIEATQSKVKETIKNNDKLKNYCKNSNTLKGVVNDDGSINEKELDNVSMAVTHEQSKEHKGFWARVKGFFKSLFGGGDDNEKTKKYDDNEIKELLKQIKELLEELKNKNSNSSKDSETSKNESLIDINGTIFENKTFRISLKDYIMNKEN